MPSPGSPTPPERSPMFGFLGALLSTALDFALLALALGGAGAVIAHPRAMALLAVWLTGALVLGAVRPVRARKGTRRESDPLLLALLLLLPLLAPAIAAWGERTGLWPLPGGGARGWTGVVIVAAGLALRIVAMMQLGSRFDPTVAIVPGHALETHGLYGRVRHPGYAGAWLAALGGVLVFGGGAGLLLVAAMGLALLVRIRHEERVLEAHFGEAYAHYRATTGAFLPRFPR